MIDRQSIARDKVYGCDDGELSQKETDRPSVYDGANVLILTSRSNHIEEALIDFE
jgi:hypothetical protein